MLLLICISCVVVIFGQQPLGDWEPGRSTFYTTWENGACNYGTIPVNTFPYNNIAAPNEGFYNKSNACGGCYEIMCIGPWENTYCNTGCTSNNATVIIEVTDECPVAGNEQWCSGDITHFDLSEHAFALIADTTCGVIKTQWRQVACNYGTNKNIIIQNHAGINPYYFGITIMDVDYYGSISNVQIKDANSNTFIPGNRQDYNVWLWQSNTGLKTPISVNITDSHGNILSGTNIITNFNPGATFDFGTNYYHTKSN